METSKKIITCTGACFVGALIYCMFVIIYSMVTGKMIYDTTILITIITTTGAAFGTSAAFYYNKARAENIIKLKRSFLQDRYKILQEMNVLTDDYAKQEIQSDIFSIDNEFDTEMNKVNQEIYQTNNM